MDRESRSALSNKDMLFTLLTAIIKKHGQIIISEDEMSQVVKDDMVMMYYDKANKKIILSMHMLTGPDEIF